MEQKTRQPRKQLSAKFTLCLVPKACDIAKLKAEDAEEFWQERVATARSKYRAADTQLRQLIAGMEKWPMPQPLGHTLVRAARSKELSARNEYVHMLNVFTEVLLNGQAVE